MGKDLRVTFKDFWKGFRQEYDFITPIISKEFNVIEDDENPQIVFCSSMRGMKDSQQYSVPKIMYTGENHRPHMYGVQASMSFDPHSDTNYHLPLWQLECMQHPWFWDILKNRNPRGLQEDARFCAYVVGNPRSVKRNEIFDVLNAYKPVNSYGKHKHNTDGMIPTGHPNKISFLTLNPHKFVVAYETSPQQGYCTEKILHAFLVGAVPIYHGDPTIEQQFNPEAFINANNKTSEEVLALVKELNQTKERYVKTIQAPVFTDQQLKNAMENIKNLDKWLINKVKELAW